MDERLARRALALGDLVFVVREDEILAAAVDIQRLAEVFHAHRRAFDMPARTAHPPWRFPRRLARLLRLPDGEIHRMALVRVNVDARAALQILKVLAAELAVAGERLRIVVNVAVVAGIGQALVDQLLNQRDDIRDMLGRARIDRRALDAQRIRVGVIFLDEAIAQLLDGDALFVGAADHLIVDIGEVLNVLHFIAFVLQIAAQRVKHDKRARVADVEIVVDRRAAAVNAHLARLNGLELFLAAGLRIIDLHHLQYPPWVQLYRNDCAFVLPVRSPGVQGPQCAP